MVARVCTTICNSRSAKNLTRNLEVVNSGAPKLHEIRPKPSMRGVPELAYTEIHIYIYMYIYM